MPPIEEELESELLLFPSLKLKQWREAKRFHLGMSCIKKLGSVLSVFVATVFPWVRVGTKVER